MNLNTPKPFTPQANRIAKDWQLWKKEFTIFLKLSGGYEKYSEENRSYLLLNLMGQEGIKAMEKMNFDHPNEKNDMDILIMKFDEIFDPPLNEAEERYKFFSRRIRENESIENFVADLKEKADNCNFGKQSDKFIIDMIVRNVDNYLRKIIFALNDITIPDLIQYYNQYSANTDKIKEITKKLSNAECDKKTSDKKSSNAECDKKTSDKKSSDRKLDNKPQPKNPCWRCNTRHEQRNCPAYGTLCGICNEKNHFSGRCKRESTNSQKTEVPQSKRICSKCGTNHPYQQCPAYNYTCYKCGTQGHYGNRCKNLTLDSLKKDEPAKQVKTVETENKSEVKKNDQKELLHCLWCDLKHSEGQCQHSTSCTRCDKFPHNICFNCKKNPHENSCYYKTVITLPAKTLDLSSSGQKASSPAEIKSHQNTANKDSTFSSYCNLCYKAGAHSSTCPRALNNTQSTSSQSTTADPLLKDYVKVNQNIPASAYQGSASYTNQTKPTNDYRNIPKPAYQGSTSYQNQTKPDNDYRNKSQFQSNQHKRSNQKTSDCCIS